MPARIPYTRVINVTLTREDAFPAIAGFGVPLIISGIVSDVAAGAVDAATRTKVYANMEDVALDWGIATEAYKAAQRIFQQNPTPIQIKIGYADPAGGVAEFDAIWAFDDNWYVALLDHTPAWFDVAAVDAFFGWIETKRRQGFVDSIDANTENPALLTSLAGRNKDLWERSSVFYHTDIDAYLSCIAAAYVCTRNFDNINSAYTLKFKGGNGVAAVDKNSAAVQAVTGWVPGTGFDSAEGHFANTFIDIGDSQFFVEGSTLSGTPFIDEVHAGDWIVARTEEEILGVMLNNARIPYTDPGINMLVQAVQRIMLRAVNNGIAASYENGNGDIVDWEITVPKVATVPAVQRRQRIAPAITCKFRYSGAVHWSEVNYTMTF